MANIFGGLLGGPYNAQDAKNAFHDCYAYDADMQQAVITQHAAMQQSVPDDLMMLKVRMLGRTLDGQQKFQDLHICRLKEKVLVFAVVRDKYVVVEDDAQMFPSDAIVNSLRLLL